MSAPWLTRGSVAGLAKIKSEHPDGIDVFTAMAIAAHKQFDDVEFLLKGLEAIGVGLEPNDKLQKIQARHEAYREALKGRTDSVYA